MATMLSYDISPIRQHECHILNRKPILDGDDACRCFLPYDGGFLPCPSRRFVAAPRPQLSGDLCATCGGAQMIRTGTCLTCVDCGSTSGGCS